jgi:hypothetical protein
MLEYLSDSDHFSNNMYNYSIGVGTWIFDKIVCVKMLIDNINTKSIKNIYYKYYYKLTCRKYIENENKYELIYSNNDGKLIKDDSCISVECDKIEYYSPSIINNVTYFYKSNIEIVIIPDKPSIFSISFIYNDSEYDIYNKLRKYFVVGNILNKSFFIAFMKKYYNADVNCSYSLKYLDKSFTYTYLKNYETIIIGDDSIEILDYNEPKLLS